MLIVQGGMDVQEIRARMAERGFKQVDLANLLDLAPNKISKALKGERQFKSQEMDKLRAWLGAPVPAIGEPVRVIPIIGQVVAGSWREEVERTGRSMPAPAPDVPKNAFALTVDGDSMDKLVDDGGSIIVDPDDKSLFPGRYYVILNGAGETTFKEFQADPARLVPASRNPAHRDLVIGGDEPFSVVGRVIWRASRL